MMTTVFTKKRLIKIGLVALAIALINIVSPKAQALSGSDFNPGRIIDDSVFFNKDTMSVNDIQNFLYSKSGPCDTNRPTTNSNYQPPWTCLYQYRENTTTKVNNIGAPNTNPAGSITAAQIIYDAAQTYNINPRALIVLIQKESSLITDNWPWSNQYRSATGYGCPDGAPCDSQYYGFYNQVTKAAFQFRRYATYPNEYNYKAGRNNNIGYNPNGACGYQTVYIQNQATAGLYNYTPYVPNAAALNNLYGTGDGCSAYGNRNFWRLFNDWFGSTSLSPYAWEYAGQTSAAGGSLVASQKTTWTIYAKNTGSTTWSNTGSNPVRLGTYRSTDRSSLFCTEEWAGCNRPATLNESSVATGETGSFTFSAQAPAATGTYNEYFNLVAEGIAWMNDPGLYFGTTVTSANRKFTVVSNTIPSTMSAGQEATGVVTLRNDGNVAWYTDGHNPIRLGTSSPLDRASAFATPTWFGPNRPARIAASIDPGQTTTFTIPLKAPSTAAVYTESFTPVAEGHQWFGQSITNTITVGTPAPSTASITSGQQLDSGGSLTSADGRFRFVLQPDGNLVLYSPNRPLWWTGTNGRPANRLAIQGDGNVVLYGPSNYYWATWTQGRGAVTLTVQNDGNVVLYDAQNRPVWYTGTNGRL
jgi:hypothetical protein